MILFIYAFMITFLCGVILNFAFSKNPYIKTETAWAVIIALFGFISALFEHLNRY